MSVLNEVPKKKRGRPTANKQIDKVTILDIAVKEFGNKGFDGTRLGDIAKQAGISHASMNYHFENKEDLWKQAVLQLGEKLENKFKTAASYLKDLEGMAALKAYTRQSIYFAAEHPEFYKIVFHEMCTKTDRASWLVENILSPIHNLFDDKNTVIENGERIFKGVPTANLSSIIIGATNTFFVHAFQMEQMYNTNPFDPKEIERHADIVIDLIFAKFK